MYWGITSEKLVTGFMIMVLVHRNQNIFLGVDSQEIYVENVFISGIIHKYKPSATKNNRSQLSNEQIPLGVKVISLKGDNYMKGSLKIHDVTSLSRNLPVISCISLCI